MENRDAGLEKVKAAIKEHPRGISISGLTKVLPMGRNTISKYVEILHISGQVDMRSYGPAKVFTISHRVPINAMLDLASDLILVMDERLELLQVNDNAVTFLGMKRERLLGSRMDKLDVPLFSDPLVLDRTREALGGKESAFEFSWTSPFKTHHFRARSIPTVLGDGRNGVTLLLEDITEQMKAREDLAYSEEKYRSLFENSEYAIVMNDDEGHFDCNRAMKRLFASDDMERIKAHLYETHPPFQPDGRDSLSYMKEMVDRVRHGETVRFEWTMRDFEGRDRPTEITISPITVRGMKMRQSIIRDLSKEKEEETKLMLLSSAMDAAVDSIIILDLKGCVIELNDSAMRMLGMRDKREVIGEYWSKKVADPNTIGFLETRYQHLLDDGYVSDVTTRVRRHDGSTIPIEVTAATIKDPSGSPRAIITVSRDITEKQHIAESIRKRDRLLQAITSSIFDMFDSDDPGRSLDHMIRTLGESADVTRSYVCVIDRSGEGPIRASIVSAWTREGSLPSAEEMRSTEYRSEGFERWNQTLSNGGIVHGPVVTFPESERRRLAEMSTRSILVAPVMLRGEWIGIMGLDDCAEDKLWSQQEINILRIAAKMASYLLERSSAVPSHPLVARDPV